MLILIGGLPGSGKSFFAARLAEHLSALHLNSDTVRRQLFETRSYSVEEKKRVYEELLRMMGKGLQKFPYVVVDATFYQARLREQFTKAADKTGNKVIFIEVVAEEGLIRERLSRKREDSEADYEVYLQIRKQFEAVRQPHLQLRSTNDNLPEMITQALNYIRENE